MDRVEKVELESQLTSDGEMKNLIAESVNQSTIKLMDKCWNGRGNSRWPKKELVNRDGMTVAKLPVVALETDCA